MKRKQYYIHNGEGEFIETDVQDELSEVLGDISGWDIFKAAAALAGGVSVTFVLSTLLKGAMPEQNKFYKAAASVLGTYLLGSIGGSIAEKHITTQLENFDPIFGGETENEEEGDPDGGSEDGA